MHSVKLNAVEISSSNIEKTVSFYILLGFHFSEFKPSDTHVESIPDNSSIRLMIDAKSFMQEMIGEEPKPSNHTTFALEYDTPSEIDDLVKLVKQSGFKVVKDPWDAFWHQHYAIVEDPDGYKVDLYCNI